MHDLGQTLHDNAVAVVFVNVMLQQVGLPVPAVPTLLVAGSLAASYGGLGEMLAAAVIASTLADWLWFRAGRRYGYRVLAGLCRLSINPGSCVSQTEARFVRWGVSSLVLAKFIPGFSTVAPPIAGALRMDQPGFLAASAAGAALWAGFALGAGWVLKASVGRFVVALETHTAAALVLVVLVAGAWLGWKLVQKYRFRRARELPHITPDELFAALRSPAPPLVLDLRSAAMIAEAGPIAGARVATHDRLREVIGERDKSLPIVTLCACPEDAGAIQAAHRLLDDGYLSVRPLAGGWEAWRARLDDESRRTATA